MTTVPMAPTSLSAELWRGRDLLRDLVVADLGRRFSGSALGVGWVFLQPLLLIAVLTAVFSAVLPVAVPGGLYGSYALFLCTGLLPWLSIEEVARGSCAYFTGNAHLIQHTSHSRMLFVAAPIVVAMLLLSFSLAVVIALAALLGLPPGPATVFLLLLVALQALLALGLGLVGATLQTHSRDTLPVIQSVLPLVFWASPIVYPPDVLPAAVRPWASWNPLSHVLACYRAVILDRTLPEPLSLGVFAALAGLTLLVGASLYRRARGTLADRV